MIGEKVLQNPDPTFDLNGAYAQNEEVKAELEKIRLHILNINYKLLPDLGLSLTFDLRYRSECVKVWDTYLQVLEQNIYHFSVLELAKIRYALAGIYPKIGDFKVHRMIVDVIKQDLALSGFNELLHVFWSFRTLQKDKIQSVLVQ